MERDPLPIAIAHYSAIANLIIVPICPYCERAHQHRPADDGFLQRMADCLRGEYVLKVQKADDYHPQTHDLKTWPEFYRLVKDGLKPFELRKNDRDYQVGDYLILREWEPTIEAYTGDVTIAKVLSVIADQTFLQPGYVAMGIEVLA